MPTAENTDISVDFDGVRVELAGDPDLVSATARRFLDIPNGGRSATATVHLELSRTAANGTSRDAAMRCVYDWAGISAWYGVERDLFLSDYRHVGRAVVQPAAGTASITVGTGTARSRRAATRFLVTLSLGELLKRRGLYFMHTAGVAVGDRAVLLAGPSGSGKSTLAAALAVSGHKFLADDCVFLVRRPRIEVLAFPDGVGLDRRSAELISRAFPTWSPGADPVAALPSELGFAIADPAAIPAAIIFPEIIPGPTTAAPLDADRALLQLAPDVLLTERRAAQAHLDVLGDLVQDLPAYRLGLGPDLKAAVDTVVRLAASG